MRSLLFGAVSITMTGASLFVSTYAFAKKPSRPASRLGRRGRKRLMTIAKSPGWAAIEPLVRWLGVRLSSLMPESTATRVDRQLVLAGDYLGLVPEEAAALVLLSGIVGVVFGLAIEGLADANGLAFAGFAAFGFLAPYLQILSEAQTRMLRINRGLPYAVDLLSLGLSAGLDFPGALRQVVQNALPGDPLAEELEWMLQLLRLGHTRRAALEELALRVPTEPVREFVHTVVHAEEKGNPLAEVLTIQAQVSRMRRTVRAEEEAAKAAVKIIGPLAIVFIALLIVIVAPLLIRVRNEIKRADEAPPEKKLVLPQGIR